ncbi:hypothetical protein SI65_04751 [Aspergillus cristatus]|uniref:Zn(2)-C6 fungal-type domain-containing protein n=1 Tax=Aspergillus cristatus TaxID=573508 RepID=A0A1E3BFK4_ASPCR|nr:hypothetical protein SI65_04751 [Aspergillus cristatus]
MNKIMVDSVFFDTAADKQRAHKRHRARHTKSRNGCYPCKFRRVKCDEVQPVCGACSFRSEPCSFPREQIPRKNLSRSRGEEAESDGKSPSPGALSHDSSGRSGGKSEQQVALLGMMQPLAMNEALPAPISNQSHERALEMHNLKLLQFFHLYTAKQMSSHQRRNTVWQRVIPELATKHHYLMHLLLALGGIHMVTQQNETDQNGNYEDLDSVDLAIIMEHHQRGLEGFRNEVSSTSPAKAELFLTGAMLLVGFAFASLKVRELNPPAVFTEKTNGAAENLSNEWHLTSKLVAPQPRSIICDS